jgi:uncharacterized protein
VKYGIRAGKVVSLPTVQTPSQLDCSACGACCKYTGLPPFSPITNPEDEAIMRAMSAAAGETLVEYQKARIAGGEDRLRMMGVANPATDIPCLWFDAELVKCKFYDDRPTACRQFKVGGAACSATRSAYGVK